MIPPATPINIFLSSFTFSFFKMTGLACKSNGGRELKALPFASGFVPKNVQINGCFQASNRAIIEA
jgi:hypothetical protein